MKYVKLFESHSIDQLFEEADKDLYAKCLALRSVFTTNKFPDGVISMNPLDLHAIKSRCEWFLFNVKRGEEKCIYQKVKDGFFIEGLFTTSQSFFFYQFRNRYSIKRYER